MTTPSREAFEPIKDHRRRIGYKERLKVARAYVGLARIFGLDLRALALFRILLALLLLASLADRLRSFDAFYTDAGVLTQAAAWTGEWRLPWNGSSFLHPFRWLASPWDSIALFGCTAVAALLMLVGWQTRFATFAAWFFLVGIDNRNPLVINAGDDVLRIFLFWAILLPLDARCSLDARRSNSPWRLRRSNRYVSVATCAFLVQLGSIYFFSALFKSYDYWVTQGTALYYALRLEQFATPLGHAVRDALPDRLLSQGTWWLELVGPLLLFIPFRTGLFRYLLFAAFTGLHLVIDWTMGIGLFSYVCIAGWLTTLPPSFWNLGQRWFRWPRAAAVTHPTSGIASTAPAWNLVAAFFLTYLLIWNTWSLRAHVPSAWFTPGVRWLAHQLRIGQLWAMFSPGPPKESHWLELHAGTATGTLVPLNPMGQPLTALPNSPERLLPERWRKLHEHVTNRREFAFEADYAAFLLREARRHRPELDGVRIVWVIRPTPPPGSAPTAADKLEILAETGAALPPAPRLWPLPQPPKQAND